MSLPTRVNGHNGYDANDFGQREFDNVLGRFFGGIRDYNGGRLSPFSVDVREDQDHLYIDAELPGFHKEDVDVTLENQTLTISAQRNQETKHDGDKNNPDADGYLLRERHQARFLRSFTLPAAVSDQKCQAKLQDGVLTITLDKREESKPRRIQVS
jgi:HSP20 family protein